MQLIEAVFERFGQAAYSNELEQRGLMALDDIGSTPFAYTQYEHLTMILSACEKPLLVEYHYQQNLANLTALREKSMTIANGMSLPPVLSSAAG